jgi:hypothetical protein
MARQSQQGQALRVLASSQPCSLSLSMLHLQMAKAKRLFASGGAQVRRLFISYLGGICWAIYSSRSLDFKPVKITDLHQKPLL